MGPRISSNYQTRRHYGDEGSTQGCELEYAGVKLVELVESMDGTPHVGNLVLEQSTCKWEYTVDTLGKLYNHLIKPGCLVDLDWK